MTVPPFIPVRSLEELNALEVGTFPLGVNPAGPFPTRQMVKEGPIDGKQAFLSESTSCELISWRDQEEELSFTSDGIVNLSPDWKLKFYKPGSLEYKEKSLMLKKRRSV